MLSAHRRLAIFRLLLLLAACTVCYFVGTKQPVIPPPKCADQGAIRLDAPPPPTPPPPSNASTSQALPSNQQNDHQPAIIPGLMKPWCHDATAHGSHPVHFPKIIHQTVKDKRQLSCEAVESMETWRDLNPGYEHRLYDDEDCEAFVTQNYPEVLQLYKHLHSAVERADLFRYLVLHRHGGVYADVDVKCMRPVAEWNAHNGHDVGLLVPIVFLHGSGHVKQCTNFVMAAAPCHPVMAATAAGVTSGIAVAALRGQSVAKENGVIGRTGPGALTAAIGAYAVAHGVAWPVSGLQGVVDGRGTLVGWARLMPSDLMAMGWVTAQDKISCAEAHKKVPQAYVCHQYYGSWKTHYNFRPKLTYGSQCQYWGLQQGPNQTQAQS